MAYRSTNSFTNTVQKSFEELSDQQLQAKLRAAQDCFDNTWRDQSFAQRKAVLKCAAALMRERQQALAELATLEMGKLIAQSVGEVALSAAIIDYYADHAEAFLAPEPLKTDKGQAVVETSPLGVVFGVEPWNYPYYQVTRFAAPNLMAGNVVMVKHASNVPQCALAFEQLMLDAGLPAGGYTNLFVSKDQVAALIDDERVRGVALTGSEAAGAVVAARAGQNLKKSTMELGGSDAFIVLEDADMARAVKQAVSGRMGNAGQACTASKRFIVLDAVADTFLGQFKTAMAQFQPGDPMDKASTLAPLSSADALDKLRAAGTNRSAARRKTGVGRPTGGGHAGQFHAAYDPERCR
jgi:succinate-semialdehyde dehydrogenase/glutarate-semialdehyde dehydrogenase